MSDSKQTKEMSNMLHCIKENISDCADGLILQVGVFVIKGFQNRQVHKTSKNVDFVWVWR